MHFFIGLLQEDVYISQPLALLTMLVLIMSTTFPNLSWSQTGSRVGSTRSYLTFTHPEISFTVNIVAQYMTSPRTTHMIAATWILYCVKVTLDFDIHLHPQTTFAALSTYSDVDWASYQDTRRPTTGYLIYLGSNLISWFSEKQPTIYECEYRSLTHECAETIWIRLSTPI
ncbi:uncharacterized mitochondrial protein AtMg00810-like [Pyrus x bretschneideri]|uniref:uncharacterized mitochondrial protein AtMg00810-like n=1 Tax=Pyrus x bretschneideri TaxID=225117 RepID=UPI00202F623C|nr:uncharacterized mitochondrial protein AtMg00810-like [Pyrus x bretschneideri]